MPGNALDLPPPLTAIRAIAAGIGAGHIANNVLFGGPGGLSTGQLQYLGEDIARVADEKGMSVDELIDILKKDAGKLTVSKAALLDDVFGNTSSGSGILNIDPPGSSPANNNPVYSANGDPSLRAARRTEFDKILADGFDNDMTLNQYAYNSLFKSCRKDIMPIDRIDALNTTPISAANGSVQYVNSITGTTVFVNPATNEVVGIWPASFLQ